MKRLLLIVLVAGTVVLGGCVDGTSTGPDEPTAETGDDRSEADSSGSAADPASDDGGTGGEDAAETDETGSDDGETDSASAVDGELEIHHIDVGQADATLLVEPTGETMLVDSGDWRQGGTDVIEYLESQGIDRIDHLVATHGHADHIGGHDAIIERYETEHDGVGAAYDSGVAHTSQTYDRYLDAVEAHDVDLLTVQSGDRFEFGAATVDVFNPPASDAGSDLHDNSVILRIAFGEFSYLTTGDAETAGERRLVDEYGTGLESTVYQAGHHGSSTSSSTPFVERVSPDVTVISSAHDSEYGHPHDEVFEEYADRGIDTYWTGVHGDVVLTTDGEEYDLETEREFSTDAAALLEEKPDDDDTRASIEPSIDVASAPLAG